MTYQIKRSAPPPNLPRPGEGADAFNSAQVGKPNPSPMRPEMVRNRR
jgi:hypothetical protein